MSSSTIKIATILKAQGIKGELKLGVSPDNKDRFLQLKAVFVDSVEYIVQRVRADQRFVYVKLQGIDDMTAAEKMRDKVVFVDRSLVLPLDDFEYYFEDILGSSVWLEDKHIGTLVDIGQFGAADVHVIKGIDERIFRHPFLQKLIISIDAKSKKIVYNSDEFWRVCVIDGEQ